MTNSPQKSATIPMQIVGPARITGPVLEDEVPIPLATFEAPLWPAVNRCARVSMATDGIRAVILDDRMTRSVILETDTADQAVQTAKALQSRRKDLAEAAESGSRYTTFLDMRHQVVGNLLFLRFEMETGDAAGHNMVTAAAERMLNWILETFPQARYVSLSGNFCTDKKPSAVNGILGRGKYVVTELVVPDSLCRKYLKTTPEQVVGINTKKNLIGTILAGGVRTANAHFANMLLGFYLATGQDAANIVEGSQGIVYADVRGSDLYFSCTLPNVIVGTVGAGKDLPFVRENLARIGCAEDRGLGENARRLAAIAAATVLCGELSLLAALTNPGELMEVHTRLERK